uniref:Uncharacterized protein n=1 Tax=Moniliophthora roreri TaxID=221103 RepID=A0A0W0G061_MONRR
MPDILLSGAPAATLFVTPNDVAQLYAPVLSNHAAAAVANAMNDTTGIDQQSAHKLTQEEKQWLETELLPIY